MGVGNWPRLVETEVFNIFEDECRNALAVGHLDVGEIRAHNVVKQDRGPQIFFFVTNVRAKPATPLWLRTPMQVFFIALL